MQNNNFKSYRLVRFIGFVGIIGTAAFYFCFGIFSNVSRAATVHSTTFVWHDNTRDRSIPVKIFYPAIPPNRTNDSEKYPVILFSHGLGGSIECCSYLANAWASKGLISVFLQHPGSDENIWKGKIRILNEFKESYQRNWNGRTRAEDIRFVLDQLEKLVAESVADDVTESRSTQLLAERMDLNRIGVGGYDLGCLASLLVAGQVPSDGGETLYDSRVKAVLAMSPPIRYIEKSFQEVYAPITVPLFVITGTKDDSIVGPTQAYQRRIPFDFATKNDRYLVIFEGGDHRIYGGRIFSFSLAARQDKRFQSAIIRTSDCFWQAVLQEDSEAQTVLNHLGLNVLLGGTATAERRLINSKVVSPQENQRQQKDSEELTNPINSDKLTESVENFPVSRFYRNINQDETAAGIQTAEAGDVSPSR
jgi:predicted dienelactone hydrolase